MSKAYEDAYKAASRLGIIKPKWMSNQVFYQKIRDFQFSHQGQDWETALREHFEKLKK